jgi:2,3-bisphosphoglycerate-independent phosphoglycerate mutase
MRRVVVIIPELLGEPTFLRQRRETLARMAEFGNLFKLSPLPKIETPEAMFLGMRPDEAQLRQGPLTVSALGADPPDRSTHFHLSLMTFQEGVASKPKFEITPEEQREILSVAEKLNTKLLTIVNGEGLDHGLVWESIGDHRTSPASEVDGQGVKGHLPEGDAEVALRRFIDDSINLLAELELNERRVGEELPPLNMLWPWGEGVRTAVPNLALRRGDPAMVISSSMRLQGLARLAGYRHAPRYEYGRGLNTRLSKIAEKALKEPVTIVLLDAVQAFRQGEKLEEADWFVRELDNALLKPLFQEALLNPIRITVLAPGEGLGLGVSFETKDSNSNSVPFDECALEERRMTVRAMWDCF